MSKKLMVDYSAYTYTHIHFNVTNVVNVTTNMRTVKGKEIRKG